MRGMGANAQGPPRTKPEKERRGHGQELPLWHHCLPREPEMKQRRNHGDVDKPMQLRPTAAEAADVTSFEWLDDESLWFAGNPGVGAYFIDDKHDYWYKR